jgi:hypothetical protein
MRLTNSIRLLAVCISAAFLASACAPQAPSSNPTGGIPGSADPFRWPSAANDVYSLAVDEETGTFRVLSAEGETVWESNPPDRASDKVARDEWRSGLDALMLVEYTTADASISTIVDSSASSVQVQGATTTPIESGYRFLYRFEAEGFTIPLDVTLEGGSLALEVPLAEIVNTGTNLLTSITLAPFFGCGSNTEQGEILVPSGSGGLIRFNNGKHLGGDFIGNIYGTDASISPETYFPTMEKARLPVYGISKGRRAFLAVLDEGDGDSTLTASVSGGRTSYNFVFPTFHLKSEDKYYITDTTGGDREYRLLDRLPFRTGRLSVSIRLLDETSDTPYVDMAEAYRESLVERYGIEERPSSAPLHIEFYGAVLHKELLLGIPVDRTVVLTRIDDILAYLEELKTLGIVDVSVGLTRFTADSLSSRTPRLSEVLGELGGAKGFGRLVDTVGRGRVFLAQDFVLQGRGDLFGTARRTSVKSIVGTPAYAYRYDLETGLRDTENSRFLTSPRISSSALADYLEKTSASGSSSVLLESVGDILYSDFAPNGNSREATADLWALPLGKAGREDIAITGGNAYLLPFADSVMDAPTSCAPYPIIDESIPFLQLTLSGLVDLISKPINQSSNPERAFLEALETGTAPHFAFVLEPPSLLKETELEWLYGGDASRWKKEVAAYATTFARMRTETGGSRLVSHRILQEGVRVSRYENGAAVYVNYSDRPVRVEGIGIGANGFLFGRWTG